MPEGVDLSELPPEVAERVAQAEQEAQQGGEVPSVMSVTSRYLVGRVDVTPPADDGSRVLRLFSGNGGTIIEANLSPQLCEFAAAKLTEVEVIAAADAEEEPDAGHSED